MLMEWPISAEQKTLTTQWCELRKNPLLTFVNVCDKFLTFWKCFVWTLNERCTLRHLWWVGGITSIFPHILYTLAWPGAKPVLDFASKSRRLSHFYFKLNVRLSIGLKLWEVTFPKSGSLHFFNNYSFHFFKCSFLTVKNFLQKHLPPKRTINIANMRQKSIFMQILSLGPN